MQCILQGKVKQIVGSTLSDHGNSLVTNFETEKSAAEFARLYAKDQLFGGHVIMLGSDEESKESAFEALRAFPGKSLFSFFLCP
jgi:phosphoribosylformimino-5-aminoimidazole carboxamide ribotide isomerase